MREGEGVTFGRRLYAFKRRVLFYSFHTRGTKPRQVEWWFPNRASSFPVSRPLFKQEAYLPLSPPVSPRCQPAARLVLSSLLRLLFPLCERLSQFCPVPLSSLFIKRHRPASRSWAAASP